MLIQAKRYSPKTLVGSQDVQKVNGTYRDIHHCDLAAVVTTSTFTKTAAAFCVRTGIRMTDHRSLAQWAEDTSRPPWH
ncbi:restriction endonuclease [Kitasatospora purpeofusca]|uniref:restriction endonuclease n=1 Tax=Kitasatospora purpeofusca TaxID=67352 RepID=UPI003F4AD942